VSGAGDSVVAALGVVGKAAGVFAISGTAAWVKSLLLLIVSWFIGKSGGGIVQVVVVVVVVFVVVVGVVIVVVDRVSLQ